MARRNEAVFAQAVMTIAALTLVSVLAWGVVSGGLGTGAAGPTRAAGRADTTQTPEDLEGGVLVLDSERERIQVHDPVRGAKLGEMRLDRPVATMTPTPGGVSVFVAFDGESELEVYSTTEYNHQTTLELASGPASRLAGEERTPEHLVFSENGDTLFVTWKDSNVVSVYSHAMLELELQTEFEIPGGYGPLYRNRRATRLYRRTPDGLAVAFARNGEIIETIATEGEHWRFDPSYTHLWGVDPDGGVWLIEERSLEARRVEAPPAAATAPVIPAGTATAFLLAADGEAVHAFDARAGRELETIELPAAAERLADSGSGDFWALGPGGEVTVIDPGSRTVRERYALEGVRPVAVVPSIVQREGSFACF